MTHTSIALLEVHKEEARVSQEHRGAWQHHIILIIQ
jgi:hypothetical protein